MEKTGIQAKFFSANASAIESWRGLCIGIIRYLPLKNGFKPEESSFMLGILGLVYIGCILEISFKVSAYLLCICKKFYPKNAAQILKLKNPNFLNLNLNLKLLTNSWPGRIRRKIRVLPWT